MQDQKTNVRHKTLEEELQDAAKRKDSMVLRQEAGHYLARYASMGVILVSYYEVDERLCGTDNRYWGSGDPLSRKNYSSTVVFQKNEKPFLHRYDGYELLYVMEGSLVQQISGEKLRISKDQFLIMNPHIVHGDIFDGDALAAFITISPGDMDMILQDCTLSSNMRDFFLTGQRKSDEKIEYIHCVPEQTQKYRRFLKWICDEQSRGEPGSRQIVRGLIARLLSEVERQDSPHSRRVAMQKSDDFELFMEMEKYLDKCRWNTTDEIISGKFHYSNQRLNQIMKQYTGLSIRKYCVERKLSLAQQLIQSSEMSINAIIAYLGYENKTYFYRIFREKYGMSPNEMR